MATSPTQRTLKALRDIGCTCGIVERFLSHAGPFGLRVDLFGIIDIICCDPQRGVIGIQACGMAFSAHWKKLTIEKAAESRTWLETPGTSLEIWSWSKRKRKLVKGFSKRGYWTPRIKEITLEDLR